MEDSQEAAGRPYLAATLVRLALGAGLALAADKSGLVSNPLSAVTIGIATPLVAEKLARAGTDFAAGGMA
jgi:hypothetical protein